jgi:succinyl-diaminopimelate desuccinylase
MDDALRSEIVALSSDLVRFASTADRPDQLHAACDYVAAYAEATPGVHLHRVERNGVPSVVVTLRDTRTPAIFLNGHVDVVPANPEQFSPELRGGRLYGRATQDMKGSVAVLMRLMRDLAALAAPPDVGFQFVGDEEIGGFDSTGWLLEDGWRCGFFLAAEPTDLNICYLQKGIARIELELTGVAGHASRPWDCVNPVVALGQGLVALQERFPTPTEATWRTTVVPTILQTTSCTNNQVPPAVRLTLDIRYIPDDKPQQITEQIASCFPGAALKLLRPIPPLDTPPDDPQVLRLARVASQVLGREAALYREHFASDARFYSVAGIPSVCFGPVGAGLHGADEWVDVDSLVQLYEALRQFVS